MSLSHAPVAVARHVQLLVFSLKSLWTIPALKYGFATSVDQIFYPNESYEFKVISKYTYNGVLKHRPIHKNEMANRNLFHL